jgi:hypothetical protein
MQRPNKKIGDIIQVGDPSFGIKALVVEVYKNSPFGDLQVVYYQNKVKCIKIDVVWNSGKWIFNETSSSTYCDISNYPQLK